MSSDQNLKEREQMLSLVNWATCPFKQDQIPHGNWRINHLGNYHISFGDNSYWYINLDGGIYRSEGDDSSTYASPPGERYYTPPKRLLATGKFFNGVDSRTGREKLFWKDAQGNIEMSPRKIVDGIKPNEIPNKVISVDKSAGNGRVVEVECDQQTLEEMLEELRRQREERRHRVIDSPDPDEGRPVGGHAHVQPEPQNIPRNEPNVEEVENQILANRYPIEEVVPIAPREDQEVLQPEDQIRQDNEEEGNNDEEELPSPSHKPRSPRRKVLNLNPEVRTRSMYRRAGWMLADGREGRMFPQRVSLRLSQQFI